MKYKLAISMLLWITLNGCGGGGSDGGDNYTESRDQNPPVIVLNGNDDITIEMFSTYEEQGAVATDKEDGNITVDIYGEVDTKTEGSYIIVYSAYDYSGNYAEINRTVTVQAVAIDNVDTEIDVLVYYSKRVNDFYEGDIETRVNQVFYFANIVNRNSNISLKYNVLDLREGALINSENPYQNLNNLVEYYDKNDSQTADIIYGFDLYNDNGAVCGVADLGLWEYSKGFVYADCPIDTLAHELGHTQGLNHSRLQGDTGGVFPYSLGYGIPNDFRTIMAYEQSFNVSDATINYSSPLLDCGGVPCGIEAGNEDAADGARSINKTKDTIANYR